MKSKTIWTLRVLMGWLFLWAFLDKLLGLGFATCRASNGAVNYLCSEAWVKGGSPTAQFLLHGTKGPFVDFFHTLATNPITDWLFMVGLAAVGLTLLFGILVKLGSYAGTIMMLAIYAAGSIWPANNPFLDQHLIYAVLLVGIAQAYPGLFRWKSY